MIRSAFAIATLLAVASSARAVVLYDGSLGTTPQAQGLTYLAIGPALNVTGSGATTLDTSAINATYAGFGTNAAPLDRNVGYTLRVDGQLLSESHTSAARAGFSLLVISSDLKAIEIGFHGDQVFSQDAVTRDAIGEVAAYDTLAAARRYEVSVLGNAYALSADGMTILSGTLRDYSDFGGPPYTVPNSMFLGDDSMSASAAVRFSYVSVSVPEPTTLATLACLGITTLARRRRA